MSFGIEPVHQDDVNTLFKDALTQIIALEEEPRP